MVENDKRSESLAVIGRYDTEGNGFIDSRSLTELMAALDLLAEPEE